MPSMNRRPAARGASLPDAPLNEPILILDADDADRHLIGYGVRALIDALNGMGIERSSLNDVQAIYLTDTDYDRYVTHGMWREFSHDRDDNWQNETTVGYLIRKGLLRRGAPDGHSELLRHRAAWDLAVYGRMMTLN